MTAERYTVVFTGFLSMKKPGEYPYLTMDEDPTGMGVVARCAAGGRRASA